jgi:hypothetical protein
MSSAGTGRKVLPKLEHVKEYLKTLPAKIADSLVAKMAGLVVACLAALVAVFWKWLMTEHSLQMYGGMWAAVALALGGLPVGIVCVIARKRQRILFHNDEDISVVIEHRLREYDGQSRNEILMDFRVCDVKWHLKRGSAKRLLPSLVGKDTTWRIKNRGDDTMTIIREDPRVAILKHLNRE